MNNNIIIIAVNAVAKFQIIVYFCIQFAWIKSVGFKESFSWSGEFIEL